MVTKAEFIAEARKLIGVRFRHQGRTLNGVDCGGVIVLTHRNLGLPIADLTTYGRIPNPKAMGAVLEQNFVRKPANVPPQPCDVMWLAFDKEPQHLAIMTQLGSDLGILHGYSAVGEVVEHVFDNYWRSRLFRWYSVPGLED